MVGSLLIHPSFCAPYRLYSRLINEAGYWFFSPGNKAKTTGGKISGFPGQMYSKFNPGLQTTCAFV